MRESKTAHPKVSIIILNWNGIEDTRQCLLSTQQITYPHLEIIVVDNGSSDHSASIIRSEFPTITLIENKTNLGFAEGNNVGIAAATGDYLFLLNNDTVVEPNAISALLYLFQQHPHLGIAGAKLLLFDQRQTLDHFGGNWNPKKGAFDFIGLREQDTPFTPQEIDYVCAAACLIKRCVIDKVGAFDPRFFLIWEESDLCFRARRAGFTTMTCPEAVVYHKVSASFTGGKAHSTYFWRRNRLLWIEKNCSPTEKMSLYARVILPETLKMLKIRILKTAQLTLLRYLSPSMDLTKKTEYLHNNRAALRGTTDYFLRRFGNGPSWIFRKTK